jgi:hypothetical protein
MVAAIRGFKTFRTHHCVTGSMRHIYEFHGYPISEDLLLGLGSGVGFVYWHTKGALPMYGGRGNFERPGVEGLEKTVGRRTGVAVSSFTTQSATRAERALLKMLDAGEPVMLYADMGFLPYLNMPDGYHFGGHMIVVAGHDPVTAEVLVGDRDGVLHIVSLGDLARARGSKFKPFPPLNKWYTLDFSHARPPTAEDVRLAIRETAQGMLEPPIANLGVKGIRTAAERTALWAGAMSAEELRSACLNLFIFIDYTGGTGGGLFRYMYGRFLTEAAQITSDPRLAALAPAFRAAGDHWQEAAHLFQQASQQAEAATALPEICHGVQALADEEQSLWKRLAVLVD